VPATTPIYGLPHQVGTDPPCFGPGTGCDNLESVWCDFASLVETQLDQNDAIIGRTGTAIPMAKVQVIPSQTSTGTTALLDMLGDGYLTFDTVVFDTDNMATLPQGITPQRDGIYHIDASMLVNGDPVEVGFDLQFQIVIGNLGTEPDIATLSAVIPTSTSNVYRASTLYSFSNTAPIPRTISIYFGSSQSSPSINTELLSASMTVYWHSDL
jgi:hypothetical protein